MADNSQSKKLLRILPFLVPLVYTALMSFSVSPAIFPIDDQQEFRLVAESDSFLSLLGADAFQLFRPVKNLLFAVFSFLAPFGIRWCHSVGILIGALSFFPVRALCRRILGSEEKALLAASVWLLSPTLVSSAAWLSCVNILVMVAFGAGAVVLHDSAWDDGYHRGFRIFLAGICLFIALLSYECAVAVVPLLFLFDLYLHPSRLRTKEARTIHTFYWMLAVFYLVLRHACAAKTASPGLYFLETTRAQAIASSPWFFVWHSCLWFWPFGRLFIFGSYRWGSVPAWKLAICWSILLVVAGWCLTRIRKDPVPKFCLLFFLVGFAPTGNCLGFQNGPFCDCYIALASVGLAAWVADRVFRWAAVARDGKRRFYLVFLALLAATRVCGIAETMAWAAAWGDGERVVLAHVRNHPDFFSFKIILANAFFGKKQYDESFHLCREVEGAVGPDSRHMASVFALRGVYEMEVNHDADAALHLFDEILRVDSSEDAKNKWHFNRGRVFETLRHDTAAAEREYEMAVMGKDPNLAAAHRLALLKASRGKQKEAVELWKRILRIKPDDESALWHLAMAYRAAGDDKRARRMEARALKTGGR